MSKEVSLQKVQKIIRTRLKTIQNRFNFNPNLGAEQVNDSREMQKCYGEFSILLDLNRKANLGVEVPYDPEGLDPNQNHHKLVSRPECLYCCQVVNTLEWKVGRSANTRERRNAMQTANARDLVMRYQIEIRDESSRNFESRVHYHLTRYNIPGRSKEWFYLTDYQVRHLVRRLKQEDRTFLNTMLRKIPKKRAT